LGHDLSPTHRHSLSVGEILSNPVAAAPWTQFTERQRWSFLSILFLVYACNVFDRNVIAVLLEPIKHEFAVSDTLLGFLGGFAFAIFNALLGIPIARWADRGDRPKIIALAIGLWSLMTLVCGAAMSFWQLAAARVGVGIGEAGSIPPSQSLIADYFAPERRTLAFAVFTAAAVVGYLLSFSAGGYLAATLGWRESFLWAGLPGLALAVATRLGLGEPRRNPLYATPKGDAEAFGVTLKLLLRKRSYVCLALGFTLYYFVAYGALVFIPSFAVRVLQQPLSKVSLSYGAVYAAASLLGTLGGGGLVNRLARRDSRWLVWAPAIACPLGAPFYIAAFATQDYTTFLAFIFVGGSILIAGLPPANAAIQSVCGKPRRAMAVALALFAQTFFGGGFGPVVTGAVSDALQVTHGVDGLRYSLMIMMSILVLAGVAFFYGSRAMLADAEE
jgi:MFS family permease